MKEIKGVILDREEFNKLDEFKRNFQAGIRTEDYDLILYTDDEGLTHVMKNRYGQKGTLGEFKFKDDNQSR